MNVLTLNTHSWLEEQPKAKLMQLVQNILEKDYDLIALQEVNQKISSSKVQTDEYFQEIEQQGIAIAADNFVYLLAKELQKNKKYYYWSWLPNHIGYDIYYEGVALLSKQPLKPKALPVSKTQDLSDYHTRQVLEAETIIDGQKMTVYSCHFSWWRKEPNEGFAYEWQQTLKRMAGSATPKIFLGDFNNPANQKSKGYHLVKKRYKDAYDEAFKQEGEATVLKAIDGWQNNQDALRLDFVFISDGFDVSLYEVIFDGRKTPVISDHFGVSVTMDFIQKK